MLCEVTSVMSTFVTPWTVTFQAPLFIEFPTQDYLIGLPDPGDLPNPCIELASLCFLHW